MKKSLQITAIIDQQSLLDEMIAKLAHRRIDIGYSNQQIPDGRKALDTSSTEAYISGTIAIEDENEVLKIPFITNFLFTCTKVKDEAYKLEWVSSLS